MRLLHRRRPRPRAKTARPAAEPFLAAGAEEARRLWHNYVGTEHLLLVLVRDPDGGANRVLQQLDVPPQQVEEALARASCLGICPRLKMALAYAVDYADGQPLTDEHILLGMLSAPDSVAARVLARLDVSLQAAEAPRGKRSPGRTVSSSVSVATPRCSRARRSRRRLDDVLDRLAAAAYDSSGAWLTVESRLSIEARRLEGPLLRGRFAVVAAPERGAARWWRACTARRH